MKLRFFAGTLVCLIINNGVNAQIIKQTTYLDALSIKEIMKSNSQSDNEFQAFYKIVGKYGLTEENIDSNIFLKDHKPNLAPMRDFVDFEFGSRPEMGFNGNAKNTTGNNSQQPTIGGNWQSAAINGLSNFMAGRFKQEVLHMGIDIVFKEIAKNPRDSAVITTLFPQTYKQVAELYNGGVGTYYTADLLYLKQIAQNDIEQLPDNLVKNSRAIFPELIDKPKYRDMITIGAGIVETSKQGYPLDQIITILSEKTYADTTIAKVLNIFDMISQALLDKEGGKNIWVNPINLSPTDISNNEKPEVNFFYGLLYQQLKSIPELHDYFKEVESATDNANKIAKKIQSLILVANRLNTTYNYLKGKNFDLKSADELITYIREIDQTLYSFTSTLTNIPALNARFKLTDSVISISGKYINIAEAFIKKDYQKAIPLLITELGSYMGENGKYKKTVSFVTQLATLKDAEDMEALLQAYALPIGGSSIKRFSGSNLTFNGYVGLTAGSERAFLDHKTSDAFNWGLTAPIGISYTFSFCSKKIRTITLFASIIDLGSLVNQRLGNDTSSYTSLKIENFLAPGLGIYYNIPKAPVTFGVHYNYIPNLRKITYENNGATVTNTNTNVSRINFSILVDIPFFTLYNKPLKK